MSQRTKELIYQAGKAGPLLGALIGIIPQCGFSAAAAGLFAGGMVSPGTLLSVFLSTSDEMLPIMVSEGIHAAVILRILLVKVAVAAAAGLLTDLAVEHLFGRRKEMPEHPHMCEHEHCGCGEHGIVYSALNHTIRTAVFLFVISLAIGLGMEWSGIAGASQGIAGLVGMIPNCAASVLITQLFLEGIIGSGALFSGLLCSAGTGLLVLYRENESKKTNLAITGLLYAAGLLGGMIAGGLGIL